MSTDLFASDGSAYDQSQILTPENTLDPAKLAAYGAPRYTATYAISQLAYNLSLGAAIVHVFIWHWKELKEAFGGMRFMKNGQDIDDPHFESTLHFYSSCMVLMQVAEMKVYKEVPQWWYLSLLFGALAVAIGCNVRRSAFSSSLADIDF